jgi:hypothetical protein
MPAWMAGIQVCRMRPETSMSAWIPALHAGMTETSSRTKTDRGPPPFLFSKEDLKITKEEKFNRKGESLLGRLAIFDLRSSILDSRSLLLVAVPPRYFRAGITRRAKRSMDLRTLS